MVEKYYAMKRISATVHVEPAQASELYTLLAYTDGISEVRILAVETTLDGRETLLLTLHGDAEAFLDRALGTTGVESIETTEPTDNRTHALLVTRPTETTLSGVRHRIGSTGIVLRMPIVYRDGKMHTRAVGTAAAIQRVHDDAPGELQIHIDEIGRFRCLDDQPVTQLSDRQRQAVAVAHDLGYYDQPRGATHEEVANRLDCAPTTASDHLQKAETKLLNTILDTAPLPE